MTPADRTVPFTLPAEMDGDLLGNAFRDIHFIPQAGDAHVGWVRRNGNATHTAKTARKS